MDDKEPRVSIPPPGPKAKAIMKRDLTNISSSFVRWYPLVAESGSGMHVVDVDGNSVT